MKNLLSSIVDDAYATCVDLNSIPDWSEILTALEKRNAVYMDSHVLHVPPSMSASDLQIKKASVLSFKPEITSCESLLNLLRKIPEVHLTTKSFSQYATCILHLERSVCPPFFLFTSVIPAVNFDILIFEGIFVYQSYSLFVK